MENKDLIRVRHMLDAAREASGFIQGLARDDLEKNRMLTLALIKELEIIGEAAAKVSPAARAECPDIPWTDIVCMRNRLIHGYFDIDLDRVWDTVTCDLPELLAALEQLIPPANE